MTRVQNKQNSQTLAHFQNNTFYITVVSGVHNPAGPGAGLSARVHGARRPAHVRLRTEPAELHWRHRWTYRQVRNILNKTLVLSMSI